jgi:hypothetical protein
MNEIGGGDAANACPFLNFSVIFWNEPTWIPASTEAGVEELGDTEDEWETPSHDEIEDEADALYDTPTIWPLSEIPGNPYM